MKMVRLIDESDRFLIDAEGNIKVFGVTVFRQNFRFEMNKKSKRWINSRTQSRATKKQSVKLNFWIRQHKKFVLSQLEAN